MHHSQLEHLTMKHATVKLALIVNLPIAQPPTCVNQGAMPHNQLVLHMLKIVIVRQQVTV
jgi:hypothetical protein